MLKNQKEREESTNGIAHSADRGIQNIKATISHRPEVQGWLLLGAGTLLLLHAVRPEWIPLLNYVLIGIALYLLLYGGHQAHLIERTTELINWVKARFGGSSKK